MAKCLCFLNFIWKTVLIASIVHSSEKQHFFKPTNNIDLLSSKKKKDFLATGLKTIYKNSLLLYVIWVQPNKILKSFFTFSQFFDLKNVERKNNRGDESHGNAFSSLDRYFYWKKLQGKNMKLYRPHSSFIVISTQYVYSANFFTFNYKESKKWNRIKNFTVDWTGVQHQWNKSSHIGFANDTVQPYTISG